MRKTGKWKCGAVCVMSGGLITAAIGGVQLATGITFTFVVPLFHTGSNIGVGIADILFGLLICYLASNGRNKVWKMKVNLVLATLMGLLNLGNIILMELGEWRLFEPTEQLKSIAKYDPHLVTIAYFSTTLPAALVLVLAIVDVEYVGCSLSSRKNQRLDGSEPTLKLRFSSESLESCSDSNTQNSLFGWVFGGQEPSASKSNFSAEVVRSTTATLRRKFQPDAMELLYQEGDSSSNDSAIADQLSTFSPMSTNNWTLQAKGPIALGECTTSFAPTPRDLETPPQTEFMHPQTANYAPVKTKKYKDVSMKTVKPRTLYDDTRQKTVATGSNSPFFCENPEKFLAAKLLAEAVCSSRKAGPNNNTNNNFVPIHKHSSSMPSICKSTMCEDGDESISVPHFASTPKPIEDEFLPTDPESLVQLTRLELIARQWRVAAQHREIHCRVSERLNKTKTPT